MKLLFDQNLSPKLVDQLAKLCPGSAHVLRVNLDQASDEAVWNYARQEKFLIVTKNADFHERSLLSDDPPKIVWIKRGNCSTKTIAHILEQHYQDIQTLGDSPDTTLLVLV